MSNKKVALYAVLRLCQKIELDGEFQDIEGMAGYLPVFATRKEADDAAANGKFKVMILVGSEV